MTQETSGGVRRRGRPSTGVREAVLRAAVEVLAERGVGGLTTKEIARRAGVAESSIFYHFKDRLGLLQAIISASVPGNAESVRPAGDALEDALTRLLDGLEAFYRRVIPVQAAVLSDPDLRETFAQRTAEIDIGPHRALQPIASYLEGEQRAGRMRADADPRSLALALIGVAHQRALHAELGVAAERLPPSRTVAATLAAAFAPPVAS